MMLNDADAKPLAEALSQDQRHQSIQMFKRTVRPQKLKAGLEDAAEAISGLCRRRNARAIEQMFLRWPFNRRVSACLVRVTAFDLFSG